MNDQCLIWISLAVILAVIVFSIFFTSLFQGKPDVMLIDHDGEIEFRQSWSIGEKRFAHRYKDRIVQLMPDGTVRGAAYVIKWEEL